MPPTKKSPRIDSKASCIRTASTTVKLPRSLQIDSPSFDASTLVPEMSGKYMAIVKKIKELDALDRRDHGTRFKHFIFTDMRDSAAGAKALAAFMIAEGFTFQMNNAPKFIMRRGERVATKEGETSLVVGAPVRHGNNGFAMLQSAPLWKTPLSVATKKEILRVFNSRPDNVHGELLRIIILDSKFKEGIDLFDVKYVHFVEPPLADADLKQALGRATRYCGQKGLRFVPNRGWDLQVFTYTTDIPGRAPYLHDLDTHVYREKDIVPRPGGVHTPPGSKVFSMFAHGSDKIQTRRLRVPKNCVYITLTECGEISVVFSQFGDLFSQPDTVFEGMTIRNILSNPLEQQPRLTRLFHSFGLPDPHIHYHDDGPETEDNTYIDADFTLALTWNQEKLLKKMARSGLYELGTYTLEGMNKITYGKGQKARYQYMKDVDKLSDVLSLYEHSLAPTPKRVQDFITAQKITTFDQFHTAMGTSQRLYSTQASLFQALPGIYYNPVCRAYHHTNRPLAQAIRSKERIQYVDAHRLVLQYSGIDLGFLELTKQITDLAIQSAVDAHLNRNINRRIQEQEGGVADIERCFRRKSRRFPFSKTWMVRVAKRLGLATPKKAKREYYCRLLDENRQYHDALLRGTTPDVPQPPVEAPPPVRPPRAQPLLLENRAQPLLLENRAQPLLLENRKDTLADLAKEPYAAFQEGVARMFSKYTWKRTVLENGCVPSEGAPEPPPRGNIITFNPTQEFIRHYLTPASPFKGLLAWHSVGTGKTCTAVATATSSFEQSGYQILWVTRNSLLSDVWKNIFGSVCSIPILEKLKAGETIPEDSTKQKRMLSRAWLPPVSYRTFQNALERRNELGRRLYERNSRDPLHKTFLIIDEVHKLYDGDLLPSEVADFKTLQRYIHESYTASTKDSVRVLLMSATPITERPDQLFGIVNTLRTKDYIPEFSEFRRRFCTDDGVSEAGQTFLKERMKGLISYLNREFDPTTFAQPQFHTIRVPIGEYAGMDVKQIVEDCMPPGLDTYRECMRDTAENEIGALKRDEMSAKNYRAEVSKIRKRQTTRKAACKKTLFGEMKTCYDTRKRRSDLSQMTALESCFGTASTSMPSFADVKQEFERSQGIASGRDSIRSTGAVRTALT